MVNLSLSKTEARELMRQLLYSKNYTLITVEQKLIRKADKGEF